MVSSPPAMSAASSVPGALGASCCATVREKCDMTQPGASWLRRLEGCRQLRPLVFSDGKSASSVPTRRRARTFPPPAPRVSPPSLSFIDASCNDDHRHSRGHVLLVRRLARRGPRSRRLGATEDPSPLLLEFEAEVLRRLDPGRAVLAQVASPFLAVVAAAAAAAVDSGLPRGRARGCRSSSWTSSGPISGWLGRNRTCARGPRRRSVWFSVLRAGTWRYSGGRGSRLPVWGCTYAAGGGHLAVAEMCAGARLPVE